MKLPRTITLAEIAQLCDGKIEGPADTRVHAVALDPLKATTGELALVFDAKLIKRLPECRASAVVVPEGTDTGIPKVSVKRPLLALSSMLKAVQPKRFLPEPGIHKTAIVDRTCQIEEDVAIGPYVVVGPGSKIGQGTKIMAGCYIGGQVTIGEGCVLHPHCLVADYVRISNRVTLKQGASIGSDGFGYVTQKPSHMERLLSGINELSDEPNPLVKIPQIGIVIIEDDVEIGSYTTIDRATMGATIIGKGSKIDNQVMVAHNVVIGHEVIIVSHSSIAGSSVIGDRAIVAGHAGVKDHIAVGKDAIVEAMAGVMRDVPNGQVVSGIPAVDVREYFTNFAHLRKLPNLSSELKSVKKRLAELEALLQEQDSLKAGSDV